MDAATLHARIDAGMGKAARRLGITATAYRPSGASNPIAGGNIVGTLPMAVSADPGYRYAKPDGYGGAVWFGLLDTSTLRVGDYLIRPDRRTGTNDGGTWFVAALQLHLPPILVACNQVMTVTRPGGQSASAGYYGGPTVAGETAVMTAWPGSILLRGQSKMSEVGLPGDAPLSIHDVLLPYGGVEIRPNDVITTAETPARRYTLSGVERTDLGWRCTALLAAP